MHCFGTVNPGGGESPRRGKVFEITNLTYFLIHNLPNIFLFVCSFFPLLAKGVVAYFLLIFMLLMWTYVLLFI